MSSASRGLAPRVGLELLVLKLGRIGPLTELCHGPQVGKSGYPCSQDADIYKCFLTKFHLPKALNLPAMAPEKSLDDPQVKGIFHSSFDKLEC